MVLPSGVIRVGVTRGANWRSHLYFSWKKTDDLFSYQFYSVTPSQNWLLKLTPFFAPHHSLFYFTRVSPFLPVRPLFSTILCKFSHKKNYNSGFTPRGCHAGRSVPRPSLVKPLVSPGAVRPPLVTPLTWIMTY